LEFEVLLRQRLDARRLVEVCPLDLEDVSGLLAGNDLLVSAVDLLLEVLHPVLDREQAHRRGDGGNRPEQEPAMDHARTFSATPTAADGSTGRRVTSRKVAACCAGRGGAWRDGDGVRAEWARTNSLTARSSSEWKDTTASLPPGASACSAATRPRSSSPSSSL